MYGDWETSSHAKLSAVQGESVQEVSRTAEKNRNQILSEKGERFRLILRKELVKKNLIMCLLICGGKMLDTFKNVDNLKPDNTYRLLTHLPTQERFIYWVFNKFLLHRQHGISHTRNVQKFIFIFMNICGCKVRGMYKVI